MKDILKDILSKYCKLLLSKSANMENAEMQIWKLIQL